MSSVFDCLDAAQLLPALRQARQAIARGELVVLPTDTVYGVGADAFSPEAVQKLLDAKGRGRQMPPPVLVSSPTTLDALASDVPDWARSLVEAFWPGALTLVCRQQPSLQWDLGETHGTVAVRMPSDEVALAVLERTGPLAVSSANLSGRPAAQDAEEAEKMLRSSVAVYVDAGRVGGGEASTIVDVTGTDARILRLGALSVTELRGVLDALSVKVVGDGVEVDEAAAAPDTTDAETDADESNLSDEELAARFGEALASEQAEQAAASGVPIEAPRPDYELKAPEQP